jgi:hypothetical protein
MSRREGEREALGSGFMGGGDGKEGGTPARARLRKGMSSSPDTKFDSSSEIVRVVSVGCH